MRGVAAITERISSKAHGGGGGGRTWGSRSPRDAPRWVLRPQPPSGSETAGPFMGNECRV